MKPHSTPQSALAGVLAGVLLAGLPTAALPAAGPAARTANQAQDRRPAQPPPRTTFEGTSEVLAVEVPVNVTGRDGRPVRGLTAADFEVWDEGDRQKITSFEVVDLATLDAAGTAAGPDGVPKAPEASGAAKTKPPEASGAARTKPPEASGAAQAMEPLGSTARRHFLLLFDLSFSTPTAIVKARRAARDFLLRSLHPTDLAAVVTFSLETGPRLLVTFTPDRAQLARAIDTLGTRRPTEGQAKLDPLRFLIEPPEIADGIAVVDNDSDPTGDERGGVSQRSDQAVLEHLVAIGKLADKNQKAFDRSRIKAFTRSMADMARTLDSVKGRKHLIYFSEGFDSRLVLGREPIGEEVDEENLLLQRGRRDLVDTDNRFGNTEMQSAVGAMLEQFRRADCVIQAVDIGGLRAAGDISETGRGPGQDSLFYMANETGGELFKDANNLGRELERVLDHTSVTYLLTFQRSDLKPDGAYHRLRVKAKLPAGARLSHRAGYYAPRPFPQLDPLERSLLASDGIASAAPRRDLDLAVLAVPFRAGGELAYVPVIVEVGGPALLAGHGGQKLSVEIYAYVSDAKGEMKDFFSQLVGLDLAGRTREMLQAGGLKYYGHLDLAPGRYRVRVLVRNADTGRTGVESSVLEVPGPGTAGAARPFLLPPLFFEAPGKWLLVREKNGEGQDSVIYPFTVNGEPYVPSARAALPADAAARLCLVGYNLGRGDLALDAKVLDAAGRPLGAGSLALVERTATGIAGVDKLIATFQPAGLARGEYVLEVGVTDAATGSRGASSVPFAVVD